jgi:Fe-S cluster assembly protein SufD
VVEVAVAAGASLEHVRLHEQPATAVHVETLAVTQGRDSRYRQQSFILGGRVVRSGLRLALAGRGAENEVEGLFMVDGVRQADVYTVIDHLAPHTRTVETFRGVASDRGRGAFNGRIVVHEGAAKSDSQQVEPQPDPDAAGRDQRPAAARDPHRRRQVQPRHDDRLARSSAALLPAVARHRPATARGLLTFAFCEDVVAKIRWPELRRHVEELVVGRLPDRDIIREFV